MVDLSKPVITKSGLRVRIYCTDGEGSFPVHGRVKGVAHPQTWTGEGKFRGDTIDDDYDLENCKVAVDPWA